MVDSLMDKIFAKDFYEVRTKCKNCKVTQMTRIRKGNKAKEVLKNGVCIKCGCLELEEVRSK